MLISAARELSRGNSDRDEFGRSLGPRVVDIIKASWGTPSHLRTGEGGIMRAGKERGLRGVSPHHLGCLYGIVREHHGVLPRRCIAALYRSLVPQYFQPRSFNQGARECGRADRHAREDVVAARQTAVQMIEKLRGLTKAVELVETALEETLTYRATVGLHSCSKSAFCLARISGIQTPPAS
jgi:hypothetical protein